MTELGADIRNLGVAPGACVMVHASLRAVGPVQGGACGVLDAIQAAVGPSGGLLMLLGARNDFDWVNDRPGAERPELLRNAEPFDPLVTPADPQVGWLAEAFRRRGASVTDNPEGRFAAWGDLGPSLLRDAPWNDYFGPGSPLDRLCRMDGAVLRMGADPDTTSLLHWAEYMAPLPQKRRVRRHRRVIGPDGPVIRTVDCLDDSEGIVDWPGEDYFKSILDDYLREGRGARGLVGRAESQLLDARDFAAYGANWMARRFA